MKDVLNDYGIFLGDMYCLEYKRKVYFFRVSKTREKSVFIYELAMHKFCEGFIINKNLKPSKKPMFILENNTPTKTTYEVTPVKPDPTSNQPYYLPIHKNGLTYYAFPAKELDTNILQTVWVLDDEEPNTYGDDLEPEENETIGLA